MVRVGSRIIHSLHGLGVVEAIEEKELLGRVTRFAVLAFDRLKIMVNTDQKNSMVRPLIPAEELARVMEHLRSCDTELPTNHTKRYNLNLERVKSGNIYRLCEVVRSLIALSKTKKLGLKDTQMLERSRRVLAEELSYVSECDEDKMVHDIELLAIAELDAAVSAG
ncbi:MAG: CarD family transcriptional regulator [Armatimonadetes bacterium]|nr:CarD family transcriptional regulator [Armatimonadota bacterium]